MLMFRFWSSDSRGSEKTGEQLHQPMLEYSKSVQPFLSATSVTSPSRPPKRRRQSNAAIASQPATFSPAIKRSRENEDEGSPKKKVALAAVQERSAPQPVPEKRAELEQAKEIIEHEFSHAILLKHNELRLINQELAKCQVALEQLRRCHLIPYPVNVPTPEQMVKISDGSGAALKGKPGDKVPQWAPPYGVTDGPYARHYAKWLIPDPKFDGMMPGTLTYARNAQEGRATRNSVAEVGGLNAKGRPARGATGQKLQSLSSGYPQPKDKAGPCILKRADGKTVKLVCIDCKRDNFSSTQGFINHCRIAHKRDFKSHEEAAVACGHPIEVDETSGSGGPEEKPQSQPVINNTPAPGPIPGLVHPFARENAMSESEACFSVVSRIKESMEMYKQGQLPGVESIPDVPNGTSTTKAAPRPSNFASSTNSPHLSRLLQSRGKNLNLSELVRDAKTKVDLDEISSPDDDTEEADGGSASPNTLQGPVPRMRVPAGTKMSPVPVPAHPAGTRPTSSKGRMPTVPYATPVPTPAPRAVHDREPHMPIDDDMDVDMSPHTAVSNNAPSLVSDDGEYDDSVDGSGDESEVNDNLDAGSVSDVAEINFDDDHVGPRGIHRGSSGAGAGTTMRLGKDDAKHVTFVSPVKDAAKSTRSTHELNQHMPSLSDNIFPSRTEAEWRTK